MTDEHGVLRHEFTAEAPNQLWLSDITEHPTGVGTLYLCAIKDVFSNRIVGYSIDSRMTSQIAVNALNNAAARRGEVAGCILHTDRGSQFRSQKLVHALQRHDMVEPCSNQPQSVWSAAGQARVPLDPPVPSRVSSVRSATGP